MTFVCMAAAVLVGVVLGVLGLGVFQKSIANMPPRSGKLGEPEPPAAAIKQAGVASGTKKTGQSDFRWSHIESENYREYIDRLRKIECPEETIRDLVVAELDKLYAEKSGRIKKPQPPPYWHVNTKTYQENERRYLAAIRELNQEKRNVLKSLLGIDLGNKNRMVPEDYNYLDNQLAFLPSEKQKMAREILARFSGETQSILNETGNFMTPEAQKKLDKIDQDRLEAFAQVLSPSEVLEYEMRTSTIAANLRCNMEGFEPSESEFQQIYQERKAFETKKQALEEVSLDPAGMAEAQANLQKELESSIANKLGSNRFDEYQRACDVGYQGALETARQYGLPETVAADAYRLKQAMQEQMNAIRQDSTINTPTQLERVQELRSRIESELKRQMGQEAYKAYYQHGGYWVRNL
jgi:hypothetical protein